MTGLPDEELFQDIRRERRRKGTVLMALGLLVWVAFYVLGSAHADFALGLGSTMEPTPRHLLFLHYLTLYGALGVLLLAPGIFYAFPGLREWKGWEERDFLPLAVGAAFLVPVVLRILVLGSVRITDDESLYRFAAELLASGRLTASSHPLRLFFDHAFLVNDGEMFTQYFLGWPALLSLGVLVGAPGYVNAVLSALTVPALYLLMRDLTSRMWAQLIALLFLVSPMVQLLAATELAHTSMLWALTWTAYLAIRVARDPDRPWLHALLALAFCVAFFIRPLTALGIGGPFLVHWAWSWTKSQRKGPALAAFAVPTLLLAVLFLWVNEVQTGSFLKPAYVAWQEYARANAFRFSGLTVSEVPTIPNLAFRGWDTALAVLSAGLGRLNYALFGWPTAFLFLPLAWTFRRARVFWASLAAFLVLHLPLRDAGVDTVGPVHFAELALPVLVLTGIGLHVISTWFLERWPRGHAAVLALLVSLLASGLVLYVPHRLRAVSVVGTLVSVPRAAVERTGIEEAVVFISVPYALGCNPAIPVPSRPWTVWWPMNDPDFTDDVLYANHLSVERDRQLMTYFPDRTGWIARWRPDCTLAIVPLDRADEADIPNGRMIFPAPGEVVRYDESHPATGELPPGSGW